MKISTKNILLWDRNSIRLNHPSCSGILGKIDRFIFNYSYPRRKWFYIPCFLPLLKVYKQLTVDGKSVYGGGGVNCFNEPIPIKPVVVSKESLQHCIEAANNGFFRIKRFEYNGFYGKLKQGHIKEVATSVVATDDPGIYKCITNKGNIMYIPSFALEGIEITFKVKESNNVPSLFGVASSTI